MAMSVQQIFEDKFKAIQSRLPIKMNTPNDSTSFQNVLDNVSGTTGSYNSNVQAQGQWKADIENAVKAASSKYNVDPNLVMAVIKAESGFNPNATSRVGAQGLMQLMPGTARGLGVTDPYNIQQNVDAGTRYIKGKLDQFGDARLALAAYNAGPGAVQKYNGIPPYPETQNYVKTVMKYYQDFSTK